jgi:TolB-like protein
MGNAHPQSLGANPDAIRQELSRILNSRALDGSDQLKQFLQVVVTRALDGRSDQLKEYNLGMDVFQRATDYDPKIDPIVRVQARRLRSKLDEYFATEGLGDPIVINIPKGAYAPAFASRAGETAAMSRHRRSVLWPIAAVSVAIAIGMIFFAYSRSRSTAPAGRDSVAVLPLEMFGESTYVADEFAEILTTELSKNKDLSVSSRTTVSKYRGTKLSLPEIATQLRVRWVVEGAIGIQGDQMVAKLRLIDSRTDREVWAEIFDFKLNDLVTVSSRAAALVAARIAAEAGGLRD